MTKTSLENARIEAAAHVPAHALMSLKDESLQAVDLSESWLVKGWWRLRFTSFGAIKRILNASWECETAGTVRRSSMSSGLRESYTCDTLTASPLGMTFLNGQTSSRSSSRFQLVPRMADTPRLYSFRQQIRDSASCDLCWTKLMRPRSCLKIIWVMLRWEDQAQAHSILN